jgi:hypothetical protein
LLNSSAELLACKVHMELSRAGRQFLPNLQIVRGRVQVTRPIEDAVSRRRLKSAHNQPAL